MHFTRILYNCFGGSLYLGYFYTRKSSDGDTFFAEAKLQMVLFHMVVLMIVKEQLTIWLQDIALKILGKICKITRTITLSKKQDIESLVCTEKYSRDLKNDKLGSLITQWCNKLTSISSEKDKKIAECSLNHISRSKNKPTQFLGQNFVKQNLIK